MLIFIIPVKSAKISNSWSLTSQLFERCLRSVCNQTSAPFRVVVVCNERPETSFTHPQVDYVEVDFPPPVADPNKETTGYEYGRSAEIGRKNADKARRILTAFEHAQRYAPTHAMVVDADDCVSRRLAAFVAAHPASPGWYLKKGYMYPEGSRFLYFNVRNFNVICGTSVIFAWPQRHLLVRDGVYYNHTFDSPPPGTLLTPLPFPGAVYSMANGDNIYMNAETKGQIHGSLFKMLFSKSIVTLVQKVMKYRPVLMSNGLRQEFGVYDSARNRQAAKKVGKSAPAVPSF